jgi:hypothetical protein
LQLRAASPRINFIPLGVNPHADNFADRKLATLRHAQDKLDFKLK